MNGFALAAGVLTGLAFLAHAILGGKELAHIAAADGSAKAGEVRLQVINGWHWVSADLLLAAGAFVAIGVTRPSIERTALVGLSVYFLVTGVVWLGTTLVTSRARPVTVLRLGQWIFCFLVALLAWLGR